MTLRVSPEQIVAESTSPLLGVAASWARVRVGDIAHVENGAAFSSAHFNNERRGEPLIRIRDVGGSRTQVHYDGPYDERHVVRHSDLLIGMDGDFRLAEWGGSRALLNQRVCRVAVGNAQLYSPRLLLHVLQPYLDAVHAVTSSVTVKHLSSRTIQDLPVPLPPRNEQDRIVAAIEEHLSRLDAADAALAAGGAKLLVLRAAALRDAFRMDVRTEALGGVARVVSGQTPKGVGNAESGGVPYLKVGDMNSTEDGVLREGRSMLSEDAIRTFGLHVRPPGTVVFPKRGGAIATNKKRVLGCAAAFDMNTMGVVPGDDLDSAYLRWWFETIDLAPLSDGSNVPQINHGDIEPLQVPIPTLADQARVARGLDRTDGYVQSVTAELERARLRGGALRRAILAAAFSGKLVPQDPDDEPASVLLERIRDERAEREAAAPKRRARRK